MAWRTRSRSRGGRGALARRESPDAVLAGDINSDSFFVTLPATGEVLTPCALSARALRALSFGTNRQRVGRLEGPRPLVDVLDVHALASGRRQRAISLGRMRRVF